MRTTAKYNILIQVEHGAMVSTDDRDKDNNVSDIF